MKFNLARAFIEHAAALAYQVQMLEKGMNEFPKKADSRDFRKTIDRHREAARRLYYNESADVHVHNMIKALAALYEPVRREYDALCEFVHPNYGSNRLVSSGALGAGQIRSHAEELNKELVRTHQIIEHCAKLANDELARKASYYLLKLGSWIETACQDGARLSQIFSVRAAISGDGQTKETALFFKKARTHHEAMEAFYEYLRAEKVEMLGRRNAGGEDGYLYDEVATAAGPLWVKYKLPQ